MLRLLYICLILEVIDGADELCHKLAKPARGIEIVNSELGDSPWHVGVYLYKSKEFTLICSGVIVKSFAVLTAASCVHGETPALLRVIAGKLSPVHNEPDSNAQEITVRSIDTKDTYLGEITSYSENIAILELSSEFDFNSVIQPICLDPNINMTSTVDISGWGLNGSTRKLGEGGFKSLDVRNCRRQFSSIRYAPFINYDKFCVLTSNGILAADTGAGVVSRVSDGKYYLQGILSQRIHNKFCVATLLTRHFDWMKDELTRLGYKKRCPNLSFSCADNSCIAESLKCNGIMDCADGSDEAPINCPIFISRTNFSAKKSCVLPSQIGGVLYTMNPCSHNCAKKPGDRIDHEVRVRTKCGLGYKLAETAPDEVVCSNGSWFQTAPECLKLCPGLKQPNLIIDCTYGGEPLSDCNQFQRNGTKAKYKCAQHYTMVDPFSYSGSTRCLPTGDWEESLPKCTPECGVPSRRGDAVPTISWGTPVKVVGKYPWHIGIYHRHNNSFDNICGGSIISPALVLTAAHCMFYPETSRRFSENDLLVSGGKIRRSLHPHEDFQQSREVKEVIVRETYAGADTRYEDDIAIIALKLSFHMNDQVLPVCIQWHNGFDTSVVGTVVGWGLTQQRIFEEDLKEANLQVIPLLQCRDKYPKFIPFLGHDKFCGAYQNASGPQPGDSGGGFVYPTGGRYFIQGIVSLKSPNSTEYCAFTKVETHLDWIREKIAKYRSRF